MTEQKKKIPTPCKKGGHYSGGRGLGTEGKSPERMRISVVQFAWLVGAVGVCKCITSTVPQSSHDDT